MDYSASTYKILGIEKNKYKDKTNERLFIYISNPIVLYFLINLYPDNIQFSLLATIIILLIFAFVFAINSYLHSFLILELSSKDRITMDVAFIIW